MTADIPNFTLTKRAFGKPVWLHNTKPVWVAEYSRIGIFDRYFQAYRATGPVPECLKPWDVPNVRLGDAIHGFSTLEAACRAGDESC